MNTHKECKYYLATDVFKGSCKKDKNNINADDTSCDSFEAVEKCKHCINYSSEDDYLGKCKSATLAYAEMTAVTCNDFQWKQAGR